MGQHSSRVTRPRDLLGKGFLKTTLEDLLNQHNTIEGLENHALGNGELLHCFELKYVRLKLFSWPLEDGKDGRKFKAS